MKLIHITDIHITKKDREVVGKRPGDNFQNCLQHIVEHHSNADLCVITGDLTHWAESDAYAYLKELIADFPIPLRLMLGNHDDRDVFYKHFPNNPRHEDGYCQWYEETDQGIFIYLDTIEPRTHAGHFGADRQKWLRATLDSFHGRPCYLFMHHHPSPIQLVALDEIGLVHSEEFKGILKDYKNQIKYIFHGHCHLPLSGTVCGVPVSALRGTNHQSWQDFTTSPTLKEANLTPAYNVVLMNGEDCIIHTIDYSYTGQIDEFGTEFEDWSK